MTTQNTRRGLTQDAIIGPVKPDNKIIIELVPGSSTQAVTQVQQPALNMPKSTRQLYLFHNGGFTLIELLVVVLIISILAEVALPQYQKAVMKSRLSETYVRLQDLIQAEHAYFLAHGEYATGSGELLNNKLDIILPITGLRNNLVEEYAGVISFTTGQNEENENGCFWGVSYYPATQQYAYATDCDSRKNLFSSLGTQNNCQGIALLDGMNCYYF